MNEPGGATEHVIGSGRIKVSADLEDAKRDVDRAFTEMAEAGKAKLGAAFTEAFDTADERAAGLKRALDGMKVEVATAPPSPAANPATGTVADPVLAALADLKGIGERLEAVAERMESNLQQLAEK